MLLQFKVENYRSVKDEIVLSFTSSDEIERDNNLLFDTKFKDVPPVTPLTALYGANGAGKSTIISALYYFCRFVINSAKGGQRREPIRFVTPFLLEDNEYRKKPSRFEISFVCNHILFEYGFSADAKKVYDEWLYTYPNQNNIDEKEIWFERFETSKFEIVKGDPLFKKMWIDSTRENALLLSVLNQMDAGEFKEPFDYIFEKIKIIRAGKGFSKMNTANKIKESDLKHSIISFMNSVDIFVDNIKVETNSLLLEHFSGERISLSKEEIEDFATEVEFYHRRNDGEIISIDYDEQSLGTQKLFKFIGPLLDVLEKGMTLIVDEIETHLHPLALKQIINIFKNKNINKNNAQLIFATHNTDIMEDLEWDEIWFVDRNKAKATELVALAEYKRDENIDKKSLLRELYLKGRYSGIPDIQGIFSL